MCHCSSATLYLLCILIIGALGLPGNKEKRESNLCKQDGFQCNSGDCIKSIQVCDGSKDCPDGSDETKTVCSSIVCPSYSFHCAYGACIDKPLACDGKSDCADGSDELLPECQTNSTTPAGILPSQCGKYEFRCDSGQCVPDTNVCDGSAECRDASDESISQCVNFPCPDFSFQCSYGACIDPDLKCDGVKHCNDASDEDEEVCLPPDDRPRPVPQTNRLNETSLTGKCILPQQPWRGKYNAYVQNCKTCHWRPGDVVPIPSTLSYECPENSTFEGSTSGGPLSIHCTTDVQTRSTSWTTPGHSLECYRTCKPLLNPSITIQGGCQFEGKEIPCYERVPHGTIAKVECANNYRPPDVSLNPLLTCQDGSWENYFNCIPECGIVHYNTAKPTVSFGVNTTSLKHPWHAGIYLYNSTELEMQVICGGSIISPYIILTAAHCVFDKQRKRNATEFRVAVGKTTSAWGSKDEGQQVFNVKDIVIPSTYSGSEGNYIQDVAIFNLYKIITISATVMPVCMETVKPWPVLSPTIIGYVVGWGYTQTGKQAEILQEAELQYLDNTECRRRVPNDFLKYLTYDKFCGLHSNGSKLEKGDSGGGWTYLKPNPNGDGTGLHYLRGIVSLKYKDPAKDFFTAFTDVQTHMEFIQSTIRILEQSHERDLFP